MKKLYLLLAAFLILAGAGGYFISFYPANFDLDAYAPRLPGGDFELQSLQGPVKLSDFRGKLVLIYFGYTHCPDICPTSLALTTGALKRLDKRELAQVQTLFISVDPVRDTPARVAAYAGLFHPAIIGLTGSEAKIKDVARRFGAFYSIEDGASTGNYEVDHSSRTLVLDRAGQISTTLAHGTQPDAIVKALRSRL